MLPYAGYVDPESTLAIGVHHDGHLEATERTFCSLYHTFMFGFHPFAGVLQIILRSVSLELVRIIFYSNLHPLHLCLQGDRLRVAQCTLSLSHTHTLHGIKIFLRTSTN